MPITKEFTIRLEDRPGTLGKLCQALAEQDVPLRRDSLAAGLTMPLERN